MGTISEAYAGALTNAPEPCQPRWPSPAVVRAIHAGQVREHGGRLGARGPGLVERALGQARTRGRQDPAADTHDLAAALGDGVARVRPFLDGNRRTAFQAMYVFLGLNGLRLEAREPEIRRVLLNLGGAALPEPVLAAWLRRHTVARGMPATADGAVTADRAADSFVA